MTPQHKRVTDEQLREACLDGFTQAETARKYGVSRAAVGERARRLGLRFVKRPGGPSPLPMRKCSECRERKLCLLCHRLRVPALPCESDLPLHGHSEAEMQSVADWRRWYRRLAARKTDK